MNSKEVFGKKYPGFLQQSYNVWTRASSSATTYVYEHKTNILCASSGPVSLS